MEFNGNLLKNIVSLGAHGRVQDALESYSRAEGSLKAADVVMCKARDEANVSANSLVNAKIVAVKSLKRLSWVAKNIGVRERTFSEESFTISIDTSLKRIENTITAADFAANLAKGATAGMSTALGAWALVGSLGTASTGTAIASLSGAAATNATLAWLGGGALAAGGGGMAAGTVVLGGIVAVPALLVLGAFNHVKANKKIAEIEAATTNAVRAEAECKKMTLKLTVLRKNATELREAIVRTTTVFDAQYFKATKELYPWGYLSKVKRYLRQMFGKSFFDEGDLMILSPLLQMAAVLSEMLDKKLMNEQGELL